MPTWRGSARRRAASRDSRVGSPGLAGPGRRGSALATLSGSAATMVLVAVQGLVLAPLYLYYLGPRLYGAWLATGEVLVWIQAMDLGLPVLLIQRIGAAHARGDRRAVGEYFAAGLLTLLAVGAVLALVALVLAPRLPGWLHLDGPEAATLGACFALAAVFTAAVVPSNAIVALARGLQDTRLVSAASTASAAAGFGTTLALLVSGWGLWAAAAGVAARVTCVAAGSAIFAVGHLRRDLRGTFALRQGPLCEIVRVSPVTTAGGIAYIGVNYGEMALLGILSRPELVAVYGLTRRPLDLVRAMADMLGSAVYGGFAHLVASPDRSRAAAVHREIAALRFAFAVAGATAYLAVGQSLVAVWVGPAQFGGVLLALAFATQMVVSGQAYLLNALYRATGHVARGSLFLLVEGVARLPLMLVSFWTMGPVGVPVAGVTTGTMLGALAGRGTRRALGPAPWQGRPGRLHVLGLAACLAVSLALGTRLVPSWSYVVAVGGLVCAIVLTLIVVADARLVTARRLAVRAVAAVRRAAIRLGHRAAPG